MNRDFEFRQLLRAYRTGTSTSKLSNRNSPKLNEEPAMGTVGAGSKRWARLTAMSTKRLSRCSIAFAGEANGQMAFSRCEKQLTTECISSGVRMITEREGYHARIFERRLADLGAECKATVTEASRKITEKLGDPG
jgi:hypothetical protein